MTLKAVIFDLDDTLISEREFAFSGFRAVAETFVEQLGEPQPAAARMRALYQTADRGRVFNVLCEEHGLPADPATIQEMINVYRCHPADIQLLPDAAAALLRLRPKYRLGVISDGPLFMQDAKAAAVDLEEYVDAIALTDHWGREFWKPHPRSFEWMAWQLQQPHDACVYVADNPEKDFIAPRALGWLTVQVKRPDGAYVRNAAAPGGEPHAVIDSLDELDHALETQSALREPVS